MTPIQTNKHVFFDEAGNVLESGSIYVGQPNTDPRTNPKTVTFTDAGGVSFTASQPLKTVAGRISYNGKPILAQVDGEHSMLVFDSTGKQTDYYPSIVPSEGGGGTVADFSEVTRVGLTLSDIKAFDVAVGNVAENVGKVLVTDDLGAQWLVVSATGSPGDDVDLIDFTNGLQGRRIDNVSYKKDVIQTGSFTFDDAITVVDTSDATSYRSVWTTLDLSASVPNEASSVRMRMAIQTSYPSGSISDQITVLGYARRSTSGLGATKATRIGSDYNSNNSNDIIIAGFASEFTVALSSGSTPEVDIQIIVNDPSASSNNTTPNLFVGIIGYTINSEDIL